MLVIIACMESLGCLSPEFWGKNPFLGRLFEAPRVLFRWWQLLVVAFWKQVGHEHLSRANVTHISHILLVGQGHR